MTRRWSPRFAAVSAPLRPSLTPRALLCAILLALSLTAGGWAGPHASVRPESSGVARVTQERAVFRVGPTVDHDRRTPLEKGTVLLVRGRSGDWLRVELGGGDCGWVEEKDVAWGGEAKSPEATLCNVLVRPQARQTRVDVQLTERVPFDVIEVSDPPALVLRLHRTSSKIHEIAQYGLDPLVGAASVQQTHPLVVELRFPLERHGAWGYRVGYGATPNMPIDPPGHDFRGVARETLQIVLSHPPDLVFVPSPAPINPSLRGVTVAIDPGHGGDDTGAVGVGGLQEKDINLAVCQSLRRSLERRGAQVVMTRAADDALSTRHQDELAKRVDVGERAGADLFISVHHNARPRIDDARVAAGVFVYYYQLWSAALARALVDPTADAQSQRVRAYVFRSFAVTRQTTMPSVLVEVGFLSNPDEERKMRAPDYPDRVGESIAVGVERFFTQRERLRR